MPPFCGATLRSDCGNISLTPEVCGAAEDLQMLVLAGGHLQRGRFGVQLGDFLVLDFQGNGGRLPENENLDLGLPRLQGADSPDGRIDARHGRIGHL